ncbi:hypothetical protein G5V57_14450 [Nordella sp. HKS 07]|uniref:hypothetical protein n=1 Tax=Nordella sp. HKS 07 TaxID=2712222 RepID=UPI0013E1C46A|nr:hypothetical protein [Nordella sp. HKS 07]QIG48820.1 hypothetical protein G5V57_14450 [Nordella sp. HKS 07]
MEPATWKGEFDLTVNVGLGTGNKDQMLGHSLVHLDAGRCLRSRRPITTSRSSEAARLCNASARMMQAFNDGLLALAQLRRGGKQHVIVQHQYVNVGPGGQAVVAGSGDREGAGLQQGNGLQDAQGKGRLTRGAGPAIRLGAWGPHRNWRHAA